MKYLRAISAICVICLVSQCGSFSASYTDPKTGSTYYGGVKENAVVDNK